MHNPMFLTETEVIIMLMNDIKEICHTSSALKAVKEAVNRANETADYKFPVKDISGMIKEKGFDFSIKSRKVNASSGAAGKAVYIDFDYCGNRIHVLAVKEGTRKYKTTTVYSCRRPATVSKYLIARKLSTALKDGRYENFAGYCCMIDNGRYNSSYCIRHGDEEYKFNCKPKDIDIIVYSYICRSEEFQSMMLLQ